ncbi:MAG: 30S ribosomal protein S8 [Candidatus Aenigmarchaeota archaeon]|nr:30S ribosomal protein S8 [Candidatus Aenigmarchaeota archaeon]
MRHDLLSDAMSIITNSENIGKTYCIVPRSDLVRNILLVAEKDGFLGGIELEEKTIRVELLGRINKAGSIRPRFSVRKNEYEKFEKRFLPSRDLGLLFISTPKGVMSHTEAKQANLGGKLLAYIY